MKLEFLTLIFVLTFMLGCENDVPKSIKEKTKKTIKVSKKKEKPFTYKKSLSFHLIDIQNLNPNIRVDLKYASTDNFMHLKLYSKINKALLQKEVAERLAKCQTYLSKKNPNYFLLVYDAVRPVSAQQKMWDALDSLSYAERTKFVSNPANGSVHNYGAAVDLTICDKEGIPLDMGATYDDIRKIAYPRHEAVFLASGELTQDQVNNRILLREVLASQNFTNIPTEWWHFNACSRIIAKKKYKILEKE
ncbi:MAG: M15 family metallopeptidase [Flavobacteriia bacterium]|nr:M15 family metallopeptidase [Flavobacteriia bacterium]